MIVQCETCRKTFDDEFRSTTCPHNTFAANDGQNNFAHHPDSHLSKTRVPDFTGRLGQAWTLPVDPSMIVAPEQAATLALVFLALPPVHPLWPRYLLCGIHLRDVEGQSKPPTKRSPNATHELMLIALNPEKGEYTPENVSEKLLAGGCYLTPLNIVEQVEDLTDEQFRQLVPLIARALCDGFLAAEPNDFMGARDFWKISLNRTCSHIRTQGLSCFTAGVKQ